MAYSCHPYGESHCNSKLTRSWPLQAETHKARHEAVLAEFQANRTKTEEDCQMLAQELAKQTENHVKSFRAHAEMRERDHDEMQVPPKPHTMDCPPTRWP